MAEKFNPYREESRKNWGATLPEGQKLTTEQVQLGAILRVADSLEKIEKPYVALLETVQYQKNKIAALEGREKKLEHRVRGYKGQITQLKERIAELEKVSQQ